MKLTKLFSMIFLFGLMGLVFAQFESTNVYQKLAQAQKLFTENKTEAMLIFDEIIADENLPDTILLECSKAYLSIQKPGISDGLLSKIKDTTLVEYNYLKGLSLLGCGKEAEALKYFSAEPATSENKGFANYFAGTIYLRQENYEQAYTTFCAASDTLQNIIFASDALIQAGKSAVQKYYLDTTQKDWLDKAIKKSEQALKVSHNETQKTQAIILAASLYADAGEYQKAQDILAPYASKASNTGKAALFQLALVYTKKKDTKNADKAWETFLLRFPKDSLTSEVAYRRAELWYNSEDFQRASDLFASFRIDFPDSVFVESALFFQADSLFQLKQDTRALLLNNLFLKTYPKSSYCYQLRENSEIIKKRTDR